MRGFDGLICEMSPNLLRAQTFFIRPCTGNEGEEERGRGMRERGLREREEGEGERKRDRDK